VQVYVNQHDFFINRVRKDMESDDTVLSVFCDHVIMVAYSYTARWRSLADPDTIPPKTESSLAELLVEIRATVGQEAQIVQAVFPNPSFVMQVFLQRVFAQSVIKCKSSLSCCAKIVTDSTTYGTAPHSR
jgi:exocyst complex component 5